MATFNGTSGNNSLTGGAANDLLNGLAGNDTLNGGAGADTMNGGAGNDVFIVDNLLDRIVEAFAGGTDTIRTSVLDSLATYSLAPFAYVENLTYTGTLAAQLKGNSLDNLVLANSARTTADTLFGGAGNDTLRGYGGNDSLMGDAGDDLLDGGAGADRMIGGRGDDRYIVDSLSDRVYEYSSGGFDTIESAVLKDLRLSWTQQVEGLTYTGSTAATLYGNALSNAITSRSAASDTLNGGEGNDTLDGGGGTDRMVGGNGDDVYMVSAADVVVEVAGQGTDSMVGTRTTINVAPYATTIENLYYTGATGAAVTGNAMANIVAGGGGNDTVSGLAGNDTLAGGAGRDSVLGGEGNDWLYGGGVSYQSGSAYTADSAVDTLVGGNGNDTYFIDSLVDLITETSTGGFDIVQSSIDNSLAKYANVEALLLAGDAWFGQGSSRADIIVGNQYSNYIVGGAGNDTLAGNAYLSNYTDVSDVLEGGAGDDVLVGFGYSNYYYGGEVSLFGGAGNDLYVLGNDYYGYGIEYGGQDSAGVDTAVGFGTDNSIEALEGVENLYLYGSGSADDARARSAIDAVSRVTVGTNYTGTFGNAMNATGNELANVLLGNSQNNRLVGLAGNDTIRGGAGDDTLDGGAGNDSLEGGAGNDTYIVTAGDKVVEAANGGTLDIIQSGTLTTYAAFANIEGLIYTGSANVSLGNAAGNTSNDYFAAGSGNDTLRGYGGNDSLYGGEGKDSIDGGAGADSLQGDAGNDTLLGGDGNDTLYGGEGNDSLNGGTGADYLYGHAGNDTLLGAADNDYLDGGDGNDSIDGSDGNDTLIGGNGVDSLSGGAGDDRLYANLQSTFYTESTANTLSGGDGNDTLYGSDGNDTLSGGAGNDYIVGGKGADRIDAGTLTQNSTYYSTSTDTLWGGEEYAGSPTLDADVFRFSAGTSALETYAGSGQYYFNAAALVADFQAGTDRLSFAAGLVGDNDTTIENAFVDEVAGGTFGSNAELVIFRTDAATTFNYGQTSLAAFDASAITSVIGSADAAFAVGAERLFAVDNGTSTAVFGFVAANADAAVTVDELSLIAVVANQSALVASDYSLF